MANKHTLSLSIDGLVTNSQKRADLILSRFLTSEYTQNALVENKFSFPYLLAVHKEKDDELATAVKDVMNYTFRENFISVLVDCSVKVHPDNPAWRAIYIDLSLTDADGNAFQIQRLVTSDNSKFIDIVKINNGTLPYSA